MISKKDELQQFVSKIEIEGRLVTEDGNYTVFFDEFEDAEYEFLVQNKEAILELLKSLECVDSGHTYMQDLMYCGDDGKMHQDGFSCFDIRFHLNYCPNVPEEKF